MRKKRLFRREKSSAFWGVMVFVAICLIVCSNFPVAIGSPIAAQDKKLTPEELIALHLNSLGSSEARAAAADRKVSGTVRMLNRVGPAADIQGPTMLISSGAKLRCVMQFPSNHYSGEDFAFDGKRLMTRLLPQGKRSNLTEFLNSQPLMLKEGLLGGVLSTAWALLRVEQLQSKMNYRGLKKVDGQQLHELIYETRKGNGGLRIEMHFEPETFRHMQTRYSYQIGARQGVTPDDSARSQESNFQIIESFADFRLVDGLTLPHKYKMQMTIQAQNGNLLRDWLFEFDRISHKEQLDEHLFIIK